MEQKINIAELLKDCPKGMELDCTMYDNVTFERFDVEQNRCYFKAGPADTFWTTCHGKINGSPFGKCVIFPKGKTTWEGFVPPCQFKDGDIVATTNGLFVGIIEVKNNKPVGAYCSVDYVKDFRINSDYVFDRLATTGEKEKLFQAIKDNGYKWNEKTKTLKKLIKPKFKVGDIIHDEDGYNVKITEVNIEDERYGYESMIAKVTASIVFSKQDDWELVPTKFDINTLKPFDKVLVRDSDKKYWSINFFGFYNEITEQFHCLGNTEIGWNECIPYEANKELLGTTNNIE